MKQSGLLFATLLMGLPLVVQAQTQTPAPVPAQTQPLQMQPMESTQGTPTSQNPQDQTIQDVSSYSYLQINRLSEWSNYFNDRSAGNGLAISYGLDSGVYFFGQWNRLNFDTLDGHHDLAGIGVGAHQKYNDSTSFFIDLESLRDRLSGSLGGGEDIYWRVDYGFNSYLSDYAAITGAIFTERNTDFGRRPFGERLGLSIGSKMLTLGVFWAHTANGNRARAALTWYYK